MVSSLWQKSSDYEIVNKLELIKMIYEPEYKNSAASYMQKSHPGSVYLVQLAVMAYDV